MLITNLYLQDRQFIFQSLLTLLLILNGHLYFSLNLVVSDVFPDVLKANVVWCRNTCTDDLLFWTHSLVVNLQRCMYTLPLSYTSEYSLWSELLVSDTKWTLPQSHANTVTCPALFLSHWKSCEQSTSNIITL